MDQHAHEGAANGHENREVRCLRTLQERYTMGTSQPSGMSGVNWLNPVERVDNLERILARLSGCHCRWTRERACRIKVSDSGG